jgi:hypothetical protein
MMNKRPSVAVDNFTQISGIGPAIERHLHQGHILTFAQLATMSPDDIAKLLEGLVGMSAERIAQQDWTGQARKYASELAAPKTEPDQPPPGNRQHYATFTLELLLDEDNNVRRTQVKHIQSRDEPPEAWVGWDMDRIRQFIVQRAALRLPEAEPIRQVAPSDVPALPAVTGADLANRLRLHELAAVLPNADSPCSMVRRNQPFNVRLTLDLSQMAIPRESPLDYTAAVYAKALGGGPRRTVGEARGSLTPPDLLTLTIKGTPLPPGFYRLNAIATLSSPSAEPNLAADLEGSLLHIY